MYKESDGRIFDNRKNVIIAICGKLANILKHVLRENPSEKSNDMCCYEILEIFQAIIVTADNEIIFNDQFVNVRSVDEFDSRHRCCLFADIIRYLSRSFGRAELRSYEMLHEVLIVEIAEKFFGNFEMVIVDWLFGFAGEVGLPRG